MSWLGDQVTAWVIAGLAIVVAVLRDFLKQWLAAFFRWVGTLVFSRLAGSALVRGRALAKYRRAVKRRHSEVFAPLMNAPLQMADVYVPLYAGEGTSTHNQGADARDLLVQASRAVVVGTPGAGKSILLRHLVLMWAQQDSTRHGPIPVLYELHRHNGNQRSIESMLVEQFDINGFARSEAFVRGALTRGHLMVLLDGLDEVSTQERPRVVGLIKDLAAKYSDTKIVVTCRTAVYEGQLTGVATQTYTISEFDERMIRRFLNQWPNIGGVGKVEQLMDALHDTPRLMQLARNPLLLSMIAYLYASDNGEYRQLPHSRAEFYQEATDVLLRQFKESTNRFRAPPKKYLLQKLALACMNAPTGAADRVTLPFTSVIDIARNTMADVNVEAKDATAVVTEIVERSGLLLSIDGGDRYQFAHLTLQEYFAALELMEDPKQLLRKYKADSSRWRESLKLWCGITTRDCTEIVLAAYKIDDVLGFECLADAHLIDKGIAAEIVEHTFASISLPDPMRLGERIAALGLVASDPRPLGLEVFDRLCRLATSHPAGHPARVTAISALAATNMRKATGVLSRLADRDNDARQALIQMGDLAVDVLTDLANRNHVWAVDGLGRLATPASIAALSALVFKTPVTPAVLASAWHIGALLSAEDTKQIISKVALGVAGGRLNQWVGEAFGLDDGNTIPALVGQLASLLSRLDAAETRPDGVGKVDDRVVVASCILSLEHVPFSLSSVVKRRSILGRRLRRSRFSVLDVQLDDESLEVTATIKGERRSFRGVQALFEDLSGPMNLPADTARLLAVHCGSASAGMVRQELVELIANRSLNRSLWRYENIASFRRSATAASSTALAVVVASSTVAFGTFLDWWDGWSSSWAYVVLCINCLAATGFLVPVRVRSRLSYRIVYNAVGSTISVLASTIYLMRSVAPLGGGLIGVWSLACFFLLHYFLILRIFVDQLAIVASLR